MYTKIAQELDDIASSLEAKGLTKEASDLDIVANTLEVLAAGSSSGIGTKLLLSALAVLEKGQSPLNMFLDFDKKVLSKLVKMSPELGLNIKSLKDAFDRAATYAEKGDYKNSAAHVRQAIEEAKKVI